MTKQLALEQGEAMRIKAVYYGDCLKHLQTWNTWNWAEAIFPSERRFADLIYLDPPWNSDANYNILFDKGKNKDRGHTAQEVAFTDIWE